MSWQIYILRFYFKSISLFIPKFAGLNAFKLFQKVRIKTIRKREEGFYKEVHHFKVSSSKEDLLCYEIGSENKNLVFLLHGWESNAGSLSKFAFQLSKNKYRVIHIEAFNIASGNTKVPPEKKKNGERINKINIMSRS